MNVGLLSKLFYKLQKVGLGSVNNPNQQNKKGKQPVAASPFACSQKAK